MKIYGVYQIYPDFDYMRSLWLHKEDAEKELERLTEFTTRAYVRELEVRGSSD